MVLDALRTLHAYEKKIFLFFKRDLKTDLNTFYIYDLSEEFREGY